MVAMAIFLGVLWGSPALTAAPSPAPQHDARSIADREIERFGTCTIVGRKAVC